MFRTRFFKTRFYNARFYRQTLPEAGADTGTSRYIFRGFMLH